MGVGGQSKDICPRGTKTRKKVADADLGSLPTSPTCQFNLSEAQSRPWLNILERFSPLLRAHTSCAHKTLGLSPSCSYMKFHNSGPFGMASGSLGTSTTWVLGKAPRAVLTEEDEGPSERIGPKLAADTHLLSARGSCPRSWPRGNGPSCIRLHYHHMDSMGNRSFVGVEGLHRHLVILKDLFLSCCVWFEYKRKAALFWRPNSFS